MNSPHHSARNPIEKTDVVFATMPFHKLSNPALGSSILQQCLKNNSISSKILYFGFTFAELIGLDKYESILRTPTTHLIGEWLFSRSAFPENSENHNNFDWKTDELEGYLDLIDQWIQRTAHQILSYNPQIVVCSSLFQQNVASIAVLRAIKRIDSSVTTVMGGPNAEGILGLALLRRCPWLDYVSSGDGEEVLPQLCRQILEKNNQVLPIGVNSKESLATLEPIENQKSFQRANLLDVNLSPTPCYDDYFEAVQQSSYNVRPSLLLESSRGCWWGQRSQCTFCGLNGETIKYRSKKVDQVIKDMDYLKSKHNVNTIQFVDNILDKRYLNSLFPALRGKNYNIFYETKADLTEKQFQQLSKGGVNFIQPGIESLITSVLQIMKKGTRSAQNIRCIRLCREFGIWPAWTVLHGFPDEDKNEYSVCSELIPHLVHLPPPSGFTPIRFDRYSPYHDNAEALGLDLVPYDCYQSIYPAFNNTHHDIAYFFKRRGFEDKESHPFSTFDGPYTLCRTAIKDWKQCWYKKPTMNDLPKLQMYLDKTLSSHYIIDSRYLNQERKTIIEPSMVSLLNYCREIVSANKLSKAISSGLKNLKISDLQLALDQHWIIKDDTYYVSIVCNNSKQIDFNKPPGGKVLSSKKLKTLA